LGESKLGTSPLATHRIAAEPDPPALPRAEGARERLAKLYSEYARFVGWFASRLLARPDEVEDVVQEVFLIAATKLERLTDPPQIRGWLKTVALRRAARKLRWKKVRARFGGTPMTPAHDEIIAAPGASPEDRAALAELFGVLDKMPTDLRIAWSLRYMHEETVENVAELCGCSLATAKRRIAAAQVRINEELSDG
jgi:RNA polymerase sigma-70 factor (ECF subfamily)